MNVTPTHPMLDSYYSQDLVFFSILVAVLASYTALTMTSRVSQSRGRAAVLWLAGGAFAMGLGIWSMHFIGMLAFNLPIALGYDLTLTGLSLVAAIGSSAFALWLVSRPQLPWHQILFGAVLMGAGIATMHYIGMAAMKITPGIHYLPGLFILSILIAVFASGAALWIAFRLRNSSPRAFFSKALASLVMGAAIIGMHYTGLNTQWLATVVIIVTLAVFAIAFALSMLDAHAARLSTSLHQAHDELLKLALHDSLTRLPNRLLFADRLEQRIQECQHSQRSFSLLFLDLDGFKIINDAHGHHTGDLLLAEVAQRITSLLGASDTASRFGGDEFVLALAPGDVSQTTAFAERLLATLAQPYEWEHHSLHITASIGIAVYPQDGTSLHELTLNADAAMYYAKEQGRNDYYYFDSAMNANAHQQFLLHKELQHALERGELALHYQPKYCARSGQVVGAEALLRWQHPEHGAVSPASFLPLAEKSRLIIPIGNWVIDEACRQMSAWRAAGHHDWSVAVNLSTIQLASPGLLEEVQGALARHRLEARHLTLEITESTAMQKAEESLAILNRLAELGLGISIDDFGTGYSSLLYLKRFPANELKIDRGFVTTLERGGDDATIIAAIIALGQALEMRIVAEGVETPEQRDLLTELGCDTLQGYLLGRPMTGEQLLVHCAPETPQRVLEGVLA
ncbi:putative bifunctional diguanylate cyclase/phosphodiesterase [Aeromonas caviae]|uniref:putative bifunctional diguanylate cyclase/phosphodiesterase n=1 Tax=Aeromonas caviae TaxID=648 RepID=UPI0029D77AF3|nr:EAL domain-containing protein [Aeromonas caviae]MDX7647458.1 EAL domain-containing protein [Aeromonas caviae]